MQQLSLIANLLGLALVIMASLSKGSKIKTILILVILGNFSIAMGYILGGTGINGAVSCLLGCTQALINYFFESKGKPVPKFLIGIYALSFIVINILVGGLNFYTFLAILACLAFIASILQKNGRNYRLCAIANTLIWIIYDILTHSYTAIVTHGTLLVVSVVGLLVHDLKKKESK